MTGVYTFKAASWFVLMAAVLWGTAGTARALAPEHTGPMAIGAVRLAVGGAALLAFAAVRGTLGSAKRFPVLTTVVAALSTAAYQPLFFAALTKNGVAVGTVVIIGSAPVFAGVLGLLVRGERLEIRWIAATTLAVFGCAMLFADGGPLDINAAGVALALGAGFAYAIYSTAIKQLLDNWPPDAVMAVVTALGAILLSPVFFGSDMSWLREPRGLAVALHLGLVTSALAYVLFSWGLTSLPVATAVTLSLAEPFTAALLGVAVLGERPTLSAGLGMALLLAGLALLTIIPGKREIQWHKGHQVHIHRGCGDDDEKCL